MYVCMVITYSSVWINRISWLSILLVVSCTREMNVFPAPVRAWEFGLARRVRLSLPASACAFSTLRLNLVLTHGIPPAFRGGVLFLFRQPPPCQSRVYHVTQLHTNGVRCRKYAGRGLVNLKIVLLKGAAILQVTMDQLLCASLLPHPLYYYWYEVWSGHVESMGGNACLVITYSRVWINRDRLCILLVVSWTGQKIFSCPRSRLRIWSRDTGSAVPSRVSLLIVYTQAGSGAYSRNPSRFPRRRPLIYLDHHTPLGQFRLHRVTQLRTNDVYCRESAGTGPVVLKIIPVTGVAFESPWTN